MPRSVSKVMKVDSEYECLTSCQSFRYDYQIRTHAISVVGEIRTSSSKAALYLISNEKNVVFLTQLLNVFQVA